MVAYIFSMRRNRNTFVSSILFPIALIAPIACGQLSAQVAQIPVKAHPPGAPLATAPAVSPAEATAKLSGKGGSDDRSTRAVHRPPESNMQYHRFICLVHLTGSGRLGDPVRPEYVPTGDMSSRDGVIGWSSQLTDNGKMAIVQLVAANPLAFEGLKGDKRSEIRIFEVGKHRREDIETELRKFKKDFDLDSLRVVVP